MSLTFKGSVRPGKNKCTFSLLTLVLSAMLIVQLSFIQILFQSVRSLPPQPTQRTQVVFCLWPSQHWRSCLKKNCSNWYSEAVSLTLGKPQTILRTPLITIAFYWTNNPFLRSQRGLWIIRSDANTVSVRCLDVLLGKVLSHPSRWLWRQESRRQTSQKLDKQKPNHRALWG